MKWNFPHISTGQIGRAQREIFRYQRYLPLENGQFGAFPNKYWEIWVAQISQINTVDQIPPILVP